MTIAHDIRRSLQVAATIPLDLQQRTASLIICVEYDFAAHDFGWTLDYWTGVWDAATDSLRLSFTAMSLPVGARKPIELINKYSFIDMIREHVLRLEPAVQGFPPPHGDTDAQWPPSGPNDDDFDPLNSLDRDNPLLS